MSGQKAYQLQAPEQECLGATWAQEGANYKFIYGQKQCLKASDLPPEFSSREE